METSPKPADTTSGAPKKRGKGMWIAVAAVVVIIVVVAGLYFAGYFSGQTVNISIVDDAKCTPTGDTACAFSPTSYSATGKTVTWKNNGGVQHTVTFNATTGVNPANQPTSSATLDVGNTFTATFTTSGTYHYYCNIHSWMLATVIIP